VTAFENKQAKVVVVRLSVTSVFPTEKEATDVVVRFQCPVEISSASCELPQTVADSQRGEFEQGTRQVVWRIKKFPGLREFSARFRFMFDQGIPCAPESLLGPIALEFQIPMLLSGMTFPNIQVSTAGSSSPPDRLIKEITTASCYTFNFI
jgi:AP-4 complex subunit mu-1